MVEVEDPVIVKYVLLVSVMAGSVVLVTRIR
jgi:hypothetical protein